MLVLLLLSLLGATVFGDSPSCPALNTTDVHTSIDLSPLSPLINCTWLYKSPSGEGGITVVLSNVSLVFGDDWLEVSDAPFQTPPLASYTGLLAAPSALRIDSPTLLLSLTVGDHAFASRVSVVIIPGNACFNDCSGSGRCAGGLCTCDAGRAGADCSVEIQNLALSLSSTSLAEVKVSGSVQPGATDLFQLDLPASASNQSLLVEMIWKRTDNTSELPSPLLMLQNATSSHSLSSTFLSSPDGSCSTHCQWSVTNLPDSNNTAPVADYLVTGDDGQPRVLRSMEAIPTPYFLTLRDAARWAERAPRHSIRLDLPAGSGEGVWRIGVANAGPHVLPSTLASRVAASDVESSESWGKGVGFEGGQSELQYTLRVALAPTPPCPLNCSGRGECSALGRCECSTTPDAPAQYAGDHCESPVIVLDSGRVVHLPAAQPGVLLHFFFPLDPSTAINAQLVFELSHASVPAASPTLLVNRATSGPVTSPGPPSCRTLPPSPGSITVVEELCDSMADTIVSDYRGAGSQGDVGEAVGEPYLRVVLQPETHVLANSSGYERGYFVAVLMPDTPAADGSILLRATQHPAAAQAGTPPCPLDCLGRGLCLPPPEYAAFLAAGTATVLSGTCACQGSTGNASVDLVSSTTYAGLSCQDEVLPLPAVNGTIVSGTVLAGGWAHFHLDVRDASSAPPSIAAFRLDFRDAAGAPPLLLLKRGKPPRAAPLIYSAVEETLALELNPKAADAPSLAPGPSSAPAPSSSPSTQLLLPSGGELGATANALIPLDLPPGARITGLELSALQISAKDEEAARGACFAILTARGYADAICPVSSILDAGGGAAENATASSEDFPFALLLEGKLGLSADLGLGGLGSAAAIEIFQAFGGGASDGAPVAWWGGNTTLRLTFTRPVDTGFDAFDATARSCAGTDCAPGLPRVLESVLIPGRTFVSVFRPLPSFGAAPPTPLPFSLHLQLTSAANASAACFGNCGPHGRCGGARAPFCTCDAGFFGLDCSISPVVLAAPSLDAPPVNASGSVDAGRFTYFNVTLPVPSDGASSSLRSLVISLSSPADSAASGQIYLRTGGRLPVACAGTADSGIEGVRSCADFFDLQGGAAQRVNATDSFPAQSLRSIPLSPTQGTAAGAVLGRAARSGGLIVAVSNPPTGGRAASSPLSFTLTLASSAGLLCPGGVGGGGPHGGGGGECSGHGACASATGLCACQPAWSGLGCEIPLSPLPADGVNHSFSTPSPPPSALLQFAVNCSDQAMLFSVAAAPASVPGTPAWALQLTRGDPASRFSTSVAVAMPSAGVATIRLPAAQPGRYLASLLPLDSNSRVDASGLLPFSSFNASLSLTPSQLPNLANGCARADNALALTFAPADGESWTLLGPLTGSLLPSNLPSSPPADAYELSAEPGACESASGCSLGTAQSGGFFPDAPPKPGVPGGAVSGRAALAISPPAPPNAAAFYYLPGDPRKHLGQAPAGVTPLISFQAGAQASWDMEACGALANAANMTGAVCVAVRGGCSFASKVAACEAAGARLVLILGNTAVDGASNSWMLAGDEAVHLHTPAIALSFRDGARLLRAMGPPSDSASVSPDAYYASRPVSVNATAAVCSPTSDCQLCPPGLASPGPGACAVAACPGMGPSFEFNCSMHGRCIAAAPSAFSCTCTPGWAGADCATSTQPPLFTSRLPPTVNVTPGSAVRLTFHAFDPAAPGLGAVQYKLLNGPKTAQLDPRDGVFTYNATEPAGTTIPVSVGAQGSSGLQAVERVTLSIGGGGGGGGGVPSPPSTQAPPESAPPTNAAPPGKAPSAPPPAHRARTPSVSRRHSLDDGAIAGIVVACVAVAAFAFLGTRACRDRQTPSSRGGGWTAHRANPHVALVEF